MELPNTKHETCECGHCRCEHNAGFAACDVLGCECFRYSWPGTGADLPENHTKGTSFPYEEIKK